MGPLKGIRIVEIAGIGPVPYAGMLLADLGAEVIRIDRVVAGALGSWPEPRFDVLGRGRRSVALNLKDPGGLDAALRIIDRADALIEGFRPGVAERLGLGPEVCRQRNPRLVYGRMTGWGQEGPLAQAAGHDINYIALTGALHAIGGREGGPVVPLNLVGDFGGGSLFLALGVVSALLEAACSGKGQVIDAAMVDGASSLMSVFYATMAVGFWQEERGSNMLDGGAHFYSVYETKDGKYVSVGPVEPQFYAQLLERIGLQADDLPFQLDQSQWPAMRQRLSEIFLTRTRDQWCELLEGSDVCFAPVLSLGEVSDHPHMKARSSVVEIDGVAQPAPAPRFSRTKAEVVCPPRAAGADTDSLLAEAGLSADEIAGLRARGIATGD